MICKRCGSQCVKAGKQRNGKQKYICKKCHLYQQQEYTYSAYKHEVHDQFSRMNRLGCGTNKMASFLQISINTLQKWVGKALILEPDYEFTPGGVYEKTTLQVFNAVSNSIVKIPIITSNSIPNSISVDDQGQINTGVIPNK